MIKRTSSIVLATAALCFAAVPAVAEPATRAALQKNQHPDKRPEVAELCQSLKDHVGERGKEDKEAIGVIDQLLQEFPNSGTKDRSTIAKAVSKCLDAKRSAVQVTEEDELRERANNQLYLAAAVALGEMGPESVKPLQGWIGHKRHRADIELQRRLTLSLGKTRDPKAVATLTDLLTHKDAALLAAAAEGLAYYDEAPGDTRKKIFNELLKALMSAKGSMDSNLNDTIARERYNTFSAALITSLGRLSGNEERDPEKIQRWWNKNKREDWDAERS